MKNMSQIYSCAVSSADLKKLIDIVEQVIIQNLGIKSSKGVSKKIVRLFFSPERSLNILKK
jgi:hypothetical protein